jgi:hypothetical protein
MELNFVDPRALKENPNKARRSKSNPQANPAARHDQGDRHRPAARRCP